MGSREFYPHIWALTRHLGHMTHMLDSDWLKNPLLRSDWLEPSVALYTTSGAKKYDHISPLLKELNWLPLEKLIYLRSATLAFKCMMGSAPNYLTYNISCCSIQIFEIQTKLGKFASPT